MSSTDAELHQLLGAFVLGGLEEEEHRAFTRHLRGCPTCQREAAQFSGLPALLDLVAPEPTGGLTAAGVAPAEPAVDVSVPDVLLDRVRAQRRAGRRRLVMAAALLVLAAGGLGAGTGPLLDRLQAPPTTRVVAAPSPPGRAVVEVALVTRDWGTQLDLVGSGLPNTGILYLWVTNDAGRSYPVASWNGTASGRARLTAACWMRPAEIRRLDVRSADGTTVATAAL